MVVVNRMRWGQTVIPNAFIDRYLADANGEYVKVYLLLLRLMDEDSITVAMLADRLDLMEKDVLRALRYWEKTGLLKLVFEAEQLQQLTILDLPEAKNESVAEEGVSIVFSREAAEGVRKRDAAGEIRQKEAAGETGPKAVTGESRRKLRADNGAVQDNSAANAGTGTDADRTADAADEDFKEALFVIEQYLGRILTRKDLDLFNRMYRDMHFPVDLIVYLVEYCVDLGHKKVNYLESVAEGWQAEDITSVEAAKKQAAEWAERFGGKKEAGRSSAGQNAGAAGRNSGAAAGRYSGNRFLNFEQRTTDYNAILQEEIRQNGSHEPAI